MEYRAMLYLHPRMTSEKFAKETPVAYNVNLNFYNHGAKNDTLK